MKNLLFKNEKVQDDFEKLCDFNLLMIIYEVCSEENEITINETSFDGYILNVNLNTNQEKIHFSSDYQNNKTYISFDKREYTIVYDNHPKKNYSALEYRYQKDDRLLIKRNIVDPNLKLNEKKYSYIFNIKDKKYQIDLFVYNDHFNEKEFLNYILDKNIIGIDNVNQLYSVIINSNDLQDVIIRIKDLNNNDEILFNKGKLLDYHLTLYEDDLKKEIYLKDNKFYLSEIKTKELDEDKVLIKKIGGRYGQRK